jgi:drug/metabolite transporter (DMT)-like permease
VLGGFFALLSAAAFAVESAAARRGMITATVAQALAVTVPLGVLIFLVVATVFGALGTTLTFSMEAVLWLSLAGVLHFVWGRYCNYRAAKAMGANLVGPVLQSSLLVTFVLAMWVLGEYLTPLRAFGIVLVLGGPALAYDPSEKKPQAPAEAPTAPVERPAFRPNYAEGYLFGILSATGYGLSPVLIRMVLEDKGLATSLAAGLISYAAATLAFALILLLPGQLRHARQLNAESARWFMLSGVSSCLAQMMRYLALAVAPATVVMPIIRLSLLFRLYLSRLVNPHHEEFGGRMIVATVASLVGVIALSVSTEFVQSLLPLPDWGVTILNLRWPS